MLYELRKFKCLLPTSLWSICIVKIEDIKYNPNNLQNTKQSKQKKTPPSLKWQIHYNPLVDNNAPQNHRITRLWKGPRRSSSPPILLSSLLPTKSMKNSCQLSAIIHIAVIWIIYYFNSERNREQKIWKKREKHRNCRKCWRSGLVARYG